jgi:hypothetical protein
MEADEAVGKDWFAFIVIHFPRILQTQDMSSGDGAASACRKRSQKHSPRSPFWLLLLADAIEPVSNPDAHGSGYSSWSREAAVTGSREDGSSVLVYSKLF